jgi:hypothetical protein
MNKEAFEAMKTACENFVSKVESGKARSKRSYKEMKDALALIKDSDVVKCDGCGGEVKVFAEQLEGRYCRDCA